MEITSSSGAQRFGLSPTRIYDPVTGRFLQRDFLVRNERPRRFKSWESKVNLYVFGLNNPQRFVDPSGLDDIRVKGKNSVWYVQEGLFGIDRDEGSRYLGRLDADGIVTFDPGLKLDNMPYDELVEYGSEDNIEELLVRLREAQKKNRSDDPWAGTGENVSDYYYLKPSCDECSKFGKDAAELRCRERIALKAAKQQGFGAMGWIEGGAGAILDISGGALVAAKNPLGAVVLAAGIALNVKTWNDWHSTGRVLEASIKAGNKWCKCP